jgi:hypothetical protein
LLKHHQLSGERRIPVFKPSTNTMTVVALLFGSAAALAQHKPEVIDRGKKATALVEVNTADGAATGSAFCIDKSGLFITNAHVINDASERKGGVHLVIDIGLKTQRSVRAKVLRADDSVDLALLKIDANSGLTVLELGKDDSLRDTAPVITFGYPFGHNTTVRNEAYPDITVLTSRITALRKDKGRLEGVQFDGQLNPGNSGGPVVDEFGRVIGVAVLTVRGAAMNLAIPVGRLVDFLSAPGLVFDPPPLFYKDRSLPVTWTIKVQPAKPDGKLPDKLSVSVTVADGISEPRTVAAQSSGNGVFKVKVTPVPREPDQKVDLDVRFANGQTVQVQVKDVAVKVGNARFLLSDLQSLVGGQAPRAHPRRGVPVFGAIVGLGKVKTKSGKKTITVDLNEASMIQVRPQVPPPPVQAVEARVEAKQGANVLATVVKRAELGGAPVPRGIVVRRGRDIVIVPVAPGNQVITTQNGPSDEGLVKLGGVLEVDGVPRGAGKSIHPPEVEMGDALAGSGSTQTAQIRQLNGQTNETPGNPLVLTLEGKISDLAVGGAGRFVILTLKEAHKLAIFDVNAAEIVKTITLPSDNALVAAGSRAVIIAFPDQGIFQRFSLETMTREGSSFPSPIKGELLGLAMGNDSDGTLLAIWSPNSTGNVTQMTRFSFVDPNTFKVLTARPDTTGRFGVGSVSPSGGSFLLHQISQRRVHVRAAAGGDLFAMWRAESMPSGFQTLAVQKSTLKGVYNHDGFDHLAPGPDGRSVYTGRGGVLSAEGKPARGGDSRAGNSTALAIPSPDPAYYLSIEGLNGNRPANTPASSGPIKASVHAAADCARLFTLQEFHEMGSRTKNELSITDDFTVEKRFHLIPAANLLITIPFTNDRLVLRRLEMVKALERLGGDYFFVTSPSQLYAEAGKALEHQIEACSKAGGLRYTLTEGPKGLSISTTGRLTWLAPKSPAGDEPASAIVTVADKAGQERFHKLTIRVK